MPSMIEIKCKHCKQPHMVRTADVKRGWGRFCSKSCKAKYQERITGQYANLLHRNPRIDNHDPDDQEHIFSGYSVQGD